MQRLVVERLLSVCIRGSPKVVPDRSRPMPIRLVLTAPLRATNHPMSHNQISVAIGQAVVLHEHKASPNEAHPSQKFIIRSSTSAVDYYPKTDRMKTTVQHFPRITLKGTLLYPNLKPLRRLCCDCIRCP